MSADVERARLVTDYTAAVSEERVLWKQMHDGGLGAVEVVQVYARWKAAAERTKQLGIELQTAPLARPLPLG